MSKEFRVRHPELTWLFQEMGTFNQAKMQDLRNLSAAGPTIDDVNRCAVPLLFLGGGNDAVLRPATLRRAHETLPHSTLMIVPDGPHSLFWECPDVFNRAGASICRRSVPQLTRPRRCALDHCGNYHTAASLNAG